MTPVRILAALLLLCGLAAVLWLTPDPAIGGSPDAPPAFLGDPASVETRSVDPQAATGRESAQAPGRQPIPAPAAEARRPEDLVMRVVDPRGRPLADFPVALAGQEHLSDAGDPGLVERRRTDRDGYAVFPLGKARIRAAAEPVPGGSASRQYLVHDVCFEVQPRVRLDPEVLARDVIESVQPDSGCIDVVVREVDGAIPTDVPTAVLELVHRDEDEDPTLAFRRRCFTAALQEGRARFPFVELGRDWVARAPRNGAEVASTARGAGPLLPGECREIPVTNGVGHPVVVLRAVDESGAPIANARLLVRIHRVFGGTGDLVVVTDATGRFAVDHRRRTLFGSDELTATCERETASGVVSLAGAAKLPDGLPEGRHDLGDLVLCSPRPLVSGQVFDPTGRPVAGIPVRAGDGVDYRQQGELSILGPRTIDVETDARGCFEIRGALAGEGFKVWADGGKLRSDGMEVRRGQTGVRLQCYTICRPGVAVLVTEGTSWDGTDIRLRPAGSAEQGTGSASASQDGERISVEMSPVRSGSYDLVWSFRQRPLGVRSNLRIDGDGEIATIDLRPLLRSFAVQLIGPGLVRSGAVTGVVFWRRTGSDGKWQVLDLQKCGFSITAAAPAVDLRIYANGYRGVDLSRVDGDRIVELRPGVRVRFRLVTGGELPSHPYIFDPSPTVDGRMIGEPVGSRYFTAKKRESVFILPPGRIVVRWHLERRMPNGAVGGHVLDRHAVTIDVAASGGEQVFDLPLDGAALAELMRRRAF